MKEKLEKENKHLKELLDNALKMYDEGLKEVERLNGALQTHEILLKSNALEIERLNNIINELEEYICAIEYDERNYNETWQIAVRIHNKLKELKGSDKNE